MLPVASIERKWRLKVLIALSAALRLCISGGTSWYVSLYFLMAVMDVEANFFTILAFRYTSYTSITLLDSLAIPGAMVASKMLLKCKYRPAHLVGATICTAGTILNVLSDYREEQQELEVSYLHSFPHSRLLSIFCCCFVHRSNFFIPCDACERMEML